MGSYFKPWRRKIGVVTLVMACVFAAGWVRSLTVHDSWHIRKISVDNFGLFAGLENEDGRLSVMWIDVVAEKPKRKFLSGLHLGTKPIFSVAHLLIGMPQTLLSAYLLISKPRQTISVESDNFSTRREL